MKPAGKLHFWIALKKCLMWLWKPFCCSCHPILQELGHSLLVGLVWETLLWKLWMKPAWKLHFWIALKKCLMWLWKQFWFSCHLILQELGHSLLVRSVRETLFGRFESSLFEKLIPGSLWRSASCDCESRFGLAVILFCRSLDTKKGILYLGGTWEQFRTKILGF